METQQTCSSNGKPLPEGLAAMEVRVTTNLVNWLTVPGVTFSTHGSLKLHDPYSHSDKTKRQEP
jgi:hypothetical protein